MPTDTSKSYNPTQQWEAVKSLEQSLGWKLLKEWMLDLPNRHYPNPSEEMGDQTFQRRYSKAWGMSEAIKSIIGYVEDAERVLTELAKNEQRKQDE